MKRVKCKSGIEGWQCRLRENYDNNFEQFDAYDETYNLAIRLGFDNAEHAWNVNPIIQGSTNPLDFRVVLGEHNKVEMVKDEVEAAFKKYLSGKIKKEQLIGKLNAIDNRLKRLFGSPNKQAFWFRLFKGDTLAYNAYKLDGYLSLHESENNFKHTIECMKSGVEELGVECYFS